MSARESASEIKAVSQPRDGGEPFHEKLAMSRHDVCARASEIGFLSATRSAARVIYWVAKRETRINRATHAFDDRAFHGQLGSRS